MNLRIVRSLGIATACLGLTATAVVADDSAQEQSTRAAANELLASRVAVGYRISLAIYEYLSAIPSLPDNPEPGP